MTATADWYDPNVFPELRDGPPWVMDDMIAAEPALLEDIATGADAAALALLLRSDGPFATVGCGTSEHAALAVADILTAAGVPTVARQAFEAALDPQRGGGVIAVSHEGGTAATADALAAARRAGSRTGLITARPDGAISAHADGVLATPQLDGSWCHTVGYTSPIAAALALAGAVAREPVPAGAVGGLVEAGLGGREAARAAAGALAACERLLVVGSGADRIGARELTLKIEEACYLPTAMRDAETLLHGHLPACDERTGVVLLLADGRAGGRRRDRALDALRACRRLGMPAAAISRDELPADLVGAGCIAVPAAPDLADPAAAILGAAVPLQLLALELAHARGANPDLIRRHEAPWREAARIAEEGE
jgi:fructoselysine-6-P-deglycase FrlB-like protein